MSSLSISDLTKLQTVRYANLGSLAILAFDFCITFSEEVRWTWFRPWDVIRVIFVVSRYLPFAGVGMTAYDALRVSSIVAAEALLVIRTWAFWKKSKILLIGLSVYSVLTIAAILAVSLSPTMLLSGEEPPVGTCYFESTRNSAVVYMFLVMFESVILILTVYKRVHDYKNFQSRIVVTLYHDGMFYMLCILGITLANVIIGAVLPSAYSDMLEALQLVSHSVLASRILFRLRDSNSVYEPSTSVTTMESIRYLPPTSTSMSGTATTSQV
ncbi:uncharacterized protein F5147DRAFT_400531 [Suillus discolor]|uniref:DUF6533 domain-containing protein n=1 Tax=Suillus discolor TaxID=1912936 RepID=A0A9P7JP09_9AGAM|nr:uncharacterized protein F5147DRAFT_400531 [Suillus discolor]KAG2095448.1 hypothetical protein F5147DRAFT_400531 [Suillus discolor]